MKFDLLQPLYPAFLSYVHDLNLKLLLGFHLSRPDISSTSPHSLWRSSVIPQPPSTSSFHQ
ncbi:hypothetical protein P175DRAFT_0100261 [Aspergillus ochraceoroseus IBT 24754]|uniref:Uncharacterized protein n=1 Tax=Aspergillus ochraceoroseus IBT 24754 TaxID=1392256 RepID=A0A2T5LLN2_9EURO|nr:uncharacterized protein P175DRAFT_0100261 [Aspergillus ochraceoroseus IBT 24754]PTU17196.1 hypothetical protein P175DRAFT_0100261 [Aspergillus ochraceoroseus IBT 24754]